MCAAVTGSLIAAGTAAYTIAQAEKQKKDAKRALNDYERQDLENAFEDVQISTLGSDLLREESQRTTAGAVDAARNAGVRGIVGAIPQIAGAQNDLNRDAQRYLDDQFMKREYAKAGDEQNIRALQEEREYQDLAGIGTLMNVGAQNSFNGQRGLTAALSNLGNTVAMNRQPTGQTQPMSTTGTNNAPVYTSNYPGQTFNPNQMYTPFPNPTGLSPNTFNPGGF